MSVGDGAVFHIFGFYLRDGTCYATLLLYTITNNNDFVEYLVVGFQVDSHAVLSGTFKGLIADVGHREGMTCLNVYHEVTIEIGDGGILGITFFGYGCSDNGFAVLVDYMALQSLGERCY